jgi:hypothetical protein
MHPLRALVVAAFLFLATHAASAEAGARSGIEVYWGGSWWSAVALETKSGLTKIHYSGWGPEWDEWMDSARIRNEPPPIQSARVGQKVEIDWQDSRWSGQVIQVKSGFYKVHYAGWGSEWDEWVEIGRLRRAATR